MFEKVIFTILAFTILIVLFWKFIKKRDKIYLYIFVGDILGIIIKFISILDKINLNMIFGIFVYAISIIIPAVVIFLESKKIFIPEMLAILNAKMNLKYGNNDIARKKLIKLISKYPNSYYAHRLLAQIYEKEDKDEEAIDEYVRVIEINSKDYDSYYQIAFLLNKNEKKNESEVMLKDLLAKKPEYYKASELLGNILYEKDKFREAVSIYLSALKYNPMRYELYYNLGMAYTRLNDFQTAKEYYEKAAAINSMLYHAKLNMAQIALITGELEEAEHRLMDCMQDKDTEPDAFYYLAIISMLKGEKDRAVGYANIAVELDYRFYKKVCNQELFFPIVDEIRNIQGKKRRYHFSYQELKTKKHLDDTFSLVEKLKGNNIVNKEDDNKKLNKKIEDGYYRE